jgi:hypothetical protein
MRQRIVGFLLAVLALCQVGQVSAQDYSYVPPVPFTGMLSHPRYEDGGIYVALEAWYARLSRPLASQPVAVRGFVDIDGSATGVVGNFVGSGEEALNVSQLHGPGSYTPGHNLTIGYRFRDGVAVQFSWLHLYNINYSAFAAILPPGFRTGQQLENTYLSSPVVNVPIEFSGNPAGNVALATPTSTYGIWNAASFMNISFQQEFDMVEVRVRVPIWETDDFRVYGLVGPRGTLIWERFLWRTTDVGIDGSLFPEDVGWYTNKIHNRLWGMFVGLGTEHKLFSFPAGVVSLTADFDISAQIDSVKAHARYETEDFNTAFWRSRKLWTLAPGVNAFLGVAWYPYEAIKLQLGYNYMALFNTVSSPRPIDMNIGTLDPQYDLGTFRDLHGWRFAVSFVF